MNIPANASSTPISHSPLDLIKRRALQGSLWILLGYATEQSIRLGGNLILTRLLFPEAFGVMTLAILFLEGIKMFSDIGLSANMIQSPNATQESFYNTVWTVRIFRGICITLILYISAIPLANFFEVPELKSIIPFISLLAFIDGFRATKWDLQIREVNVKTITLLEICSKMISLAVMIFLAWFYPSVWVLIVGSLIGVAATTIFSHAILQGPKNRIFWNQEMWNQIFQFGKWIFLSTAITFIARQVDRLTLGKLLSMEEFGVFSIAFMIIQVINTIAITLSSKVLFPSSSEINRQLSSSLLSANIRLGIIFLLLPPILALVFFGNTMTIFLFDPRYHAAGPILEILSMGLVASVMNLTLEPLFLAKGDSSRYLLVNLFKVIVVIVSMQIGYSWNGIEGLIAGIAASSFLAYPVIYMMARKYQGIRPMIDFSILIGCLILFFLK